MCLVTMIMDPGYMLLDSGSWLQVSGSGPHGICSRFICFDRNQQHSNASPNNIKTATFWPGEYHPVMVETDAGLTISHACLLPRLDGHHGS